MATHGKSDVAIRIVRALGLDPMKTTGLRLVLEPGRAVTAYVKLLPSEEDLRAIAGIIEEDSLSIEIVRESPV